MDIEHGAVESLINDGFTNAAEYMINKAVFTEDINHLMMAATRAGNLRIMQLCLTKGAKINNKEVFDMHSNNLLLLAVNHDSTEVLKFLLDRGARQFVDRLYRDQGTLKQIQLRDCAYAEACESGNIAALKLLFKYKIKKIAEAPLLYYAIASGREDVYDFLHKRANVMTNKTLLMVFENRLSGRPRKHLLIRAINDMQVPIDNSIDWLKYERRYNYKDVYKAMIKKGLCADETKLLEDECTDAWWL